jgi:GNAT superfamily N-acetyltransferase
MNWYKKAQQLTFFNQLSNQLDELRKKLSSIYATLTWNEIMSPEQQKEIKQIEKEDKRIRELYQEEYEKLKPGAVESIQQGRPYESPQQHFVDYHRTGTIDDEAYTSQDDPDSISWRDKIEEYPILIKTETYDGEEIEFRANGEELKYVKKDNNDEIMRDEKGNPFYLSGEEMKEKGLKLTDPGITAFNSKGKTVGYVSDEWGTDGVWVRREYQGKGIGTDLLYEFKKQFKPDRRIGQMTSSGVAMTKSYHKKLVEEAFREGKEVPREVLEYYELV